MSWKKNVFSYLLWVLYAVAAEVGLVCLADAVCDSLGVDIYIGTIACAIYIVLAGAGVFLIHRFAPKYSEAGEKDHSLRTLIFGGVSVILLAIGFALRAQGAGCVEEASMYYELAAVGPGRELLEGIHGAAYFYVQMLHGLLYFLGNKSAAAVWVQILLQMGALLLFYFAMRRLTGRIAALVTLAFCMFSSYLIGESHRLSPAMLYLFFWAAVLLMIVYLVRTGKKRWGFLAAGILIAVLSYLDVAGLLLLPIFTALIFCREKGADSRGKGILLCYAGAGAGFAGCAFADALANGKTFLQALEVWAGLYDPGSFRLPVTTDTPEVLVEYIVLFCVLTPGIYSFWRDRRRDRRKGWTLLLILMGTAGCFHIFTEEMPIGIYMYLVLAVMAGIAVEECVCFVQPAPAEENPGSEMAEAAEQAGGEAPQAAAGEPEQKKQETVEKDPEKSRRKPGKENEPGTGGGREMAGKGAETGSIQETAENGTGTGDGQDMAGQGAEAEAALPQRKVRMIENPLPLPKKHVRRRLDYGMEVPEGKYDFDLEVDDKDDFDI